MDSDQQNYFCHDKTINNMLSDNNNELLFHAPSFSGYVHPYYPFLVWFLNNQHFARIAIFDSEHRKSLTSFCDIFATFKLSTKCYGRYNSETELRYPELLLPLPDNWEDGFFSLISIDATYFLLEDLSCFKENIPNPPKDCFILLTGIYNSQITARKNQSIWEKWKKQYAFFEFFHDEGLILFYTGEEPSAFCKALFELESQYPQLAQRLRERCAIIGRYWQQRIQSPHQRFPKTDDQNLYSQKDFLESKTLLQEAKQQKRLLEKNFKTLTDQVKQLHEFYLQQIQQIHQTYESWGMKVYEKTQNRARMAAKVFLGYPLLAPLPKIQLSHLETTNLPDFPSLTFTPTIQELYFKQKVEAEKPNNPVRRVLFVSGEPHTPGTLYRCIRNAEACRIAGHEARVINSKDITPDDIKWAHVLIFWRVEFSNHIAIALNLAKEFGVLTAFDADDIVFKPQLAHIEIIDGIRTIGTTEAETSRTFNNMKQTLLRTDFAVATTKEMWEHMAQVLIVKHAGPLIFQLPNIFDDECVRLSRYHARLKRIDKQDDFIRIGYASGTRTHQRDFGRIIPALISVFRKRPHVKLVLFREPENHRPILLMGEYPELAGFEDRIEWRDTVPLKELPKELARFDISIAPLETENVFCNAKSELKYFEAALTNVCSVVSPTGPFKRTVEHGITGFLAETIEEWENCLLTLVDDEILRHKMAQNAYHQVLWDFGIQRQAKICNTMLRSLTSESAAAEASEIQFKRGDYKALSLPEIPDSEILFTHDALQEAEVTVVITCYNYSQFVIEALESVRAQTLTSLDLIIVDDRSQDNSVELIKAWAEDHKERFNRLQLRRSLKNAGLGGARNIGIAASETLYSMQLDADNRLLPNACEHLLDTMIKNPLAGFAYPLLRHFGAGEAIGGDIPFHPQRLKVGNYIDAMTMVAKWAWAAAGGYYVKRDAMGWEDYDLWCCLAELGIQGIQVNEVLAEYRAHYSSMTATVTEQHFHKPKVLDYLYQRHPWIIPVQPEPSNWD